MNKINDSIREFQNKTRTISEKAERLRPMLNACQDTLERSEVKGNISVGVRTPTEPKVEIVIFCKKLEELTPLFRELAKEGLKADKEDNHTDSKVLDFISMREYNFGPSLVVIAMMMPSEIDGASCRMEQVGTKEVPIYEMKCD